MTYKFPLNTFLIVFAIALFSFTNSYAGSNGDKLYEEGSYAKAIKKYRKVYEKDPQNFLVVEKIAKAYMKLDEFSKAELWFWKAYKADGLSEEGSLGYMNALISNSKYQIAEDFCVTYSAKYPQSSITCPNQKDIRNLMFNDKFEVTLMEFNTPYDDVNPVVYQENLYFIENSTKYSNKSGNLKVVNLAELASNSASSGQSFKKVNTLNPNNGMGFHPYTGELFYALKSNNGISDGKVYKSYLNVLDVNSGIFEDKLPYPNGIDYDIIEASFNPTGTIMFFSSTMEGGYGGSDIWQCSYENGVLGEPMNLGPQINTYGDERYPNLHNNQLYFASDGLLGLGSLDLFVSKNVTGDWGKAENLKSPINSSYNDYAITFKNEMESFFTSDRSGGEGGDDIYSIRTKAEMMTVLVYDKDTKEPMADMSVTLGSGKVVTTDANGVCSVEYTESGLENISAKKEGFQQGELMFNQEGYSVLVPMEGQKGIKFMVQVLDKESGLPMDGIFVQLNDFESTTDDAGNTYWMIYPNMDYTLSAYDSKNKSVLNEKLTKKFSTQDAETPDFWTATILLE